MRNFRIIIKNSGNCEIYNELVTAKDENKALEYLIHDTFICDGDIITIEEE